MHRMIVPSFLIFSVIMSYAFLATYHKKVMNSEYAVNRHNKPDTESALTDIASFAEYSLSIFNLEQDEHANIASGQPDTTMRDKHPDMDSQLIIRD